MTFDRTLLAVVVTLLVIMWVLGFELGWTLAR